VAPEPTGLIEPSDLRADPLVRTLLARCNFGSPNGATPVPDTAVTDTVVTPCGVSGGADSTALLMLAVAAGLCVRAVHVDHGLRPGSAAEAEVVARSAHRLGAEFVSHRVTVGEGPNLEARARRARYEVLGPEALTGHTVDDQAETVLLNLVRGAGVTGLAGIRATPRRPILGLRRSETEALCERFDFETVDDPSNTDPAQRRNRMRHEVLPLLDGVAERDVAAVIARQAEWLADIDDYIEAQADHIDPTDAIALREASPVLARAALRRWLRSQSSEAHPPDARALERVMAVARGEVLGTEIADGWRVRRTNNILRLEPPAPR
jgi:tRNA(Ile)-lysidine synthase